MYLLHIFFLFFLSLPSLGAGWFQSFGPCNSATVSDSGSCQEQKKYFLLLFIFSPFVVSPTDDNTLAFAYTAYAWGQLWSLVRHIFIHVCPSCGGNANPCPESNPVEPGWKMWWKNCNSGLYSELAILPARVPICSQDGWQRRCHISNPFQKSQAEVS